MSPTNKHPARTMDFSQIRTGLNAAHENLMVKVRFDKDTSRLHWCYTDRCAYTGGWDDFSRMARGLIMDVEENRIVATPFVKMYSLGERGFTPPDENFEATEKLDGFMLTIYYHQGMWRVSTRTDVSSPMTDMVEQQLRNLDLSALIGGTTYVAEMVGPDFKVIVPYKKNEIILLGAIKEDGFEMAYDELTPIAESLGWRQPKKVFVKNYDDAVRIAREMDGEGLMLRFENGVRLRILSDKYRRMEKAALRCTPIGVWEAMRDNTIDEMKDNLPKHFLPDFNAITVALMVKKVALYDKLTVLVRETAHMTDAELGKALPTMEDRDIASLIFPVRKCQGKKVAEAAWRRVHPKNDMLEGYQASMFTRYIRGDNP